MKEANYIPITQKDGYITKLTYFKYPKRPKASLLILHGMAEHQKRYYAFAEFLNEQGFDVYIYDHRGHGTDKKFSDLGLFAPSKGYQLVIDDALTVSEYIDANRRGGKFFLLGHSMGSFIARNIIQNYDKYNGVILSGTSFPPRRVLSGGLMVASIIKKFKGYRHISPFMNNLMFGGSKYTKLSDRTAFDWLSRSHAAVGAYIHDPYCGYICTASFYQDLLKLIANAGKRSLMQQTKKELPMYIISGEKDPVGNYGKDIKRLIALYKKLGFTNIAFKLYPECRHELLNEINNEEVYSDIFAWLQKRL
jgi:alpha-beta hydrolase superfamily lysophospholipase